MSRPLNLRGVDGRVPQQGLDVPPLGPSLESLDEFEVLALGFPEVDNLALPAGLRVEPPTARPADLGAADDDAQLFELFDGAIYVLALHPKFGRDFDLRDLDHVFEVQPRVKVQKNPQDLVAEVSARGELLKEILVDLHPTVTVGAMNLMANEYRDDVIVNFPPIVNVTHQLLASHSPPSLTDCNR